MNRVLLAILAVAAVLTGFLVLGQADEETELPGIEAGSESAEQALADPAESSGPLTRKAAGSTRPEVPQPQPEALLRILVKDRSGQPVPGVPVGLRADRDDHLSIGWIGVSDADGQAVVPRVPRRSLGPKATRALAFLNFPLRDGPTAPVELGETPQGPAELVLPPTGQVEVHVDGVNAARMDGLPVMLAAPDLRMSPRARLDTTAGRALFPFVGLGMKLVVAVAADDAGTHSRKEVDGPTGPGHRVVVRIDVRGAAPFVVGRLIDEKGDPVANGELRARLRAVTKRSSSSRSSQLKTDGEGCFRMKITDELPPAAKRTLQIQSEIPDLAKGQNRMARAVLPRLEPGENDLGVLRFGLPPLVASGVVIGAGGGGPIANARVHVERKVVHDAARADGYYWKKESGLTASTGSDGRFECRGWTEGAELAVSAEHDAYLPSVRQPAPMGAAGLQILMSKAGAVAGNVLLVDGVEAHDVLITLRRDGKKVEERPDGEGHFRFSAVKPGVASVSVRTFGTHDPLLVVPGVAVHSGETTKDPRLQDIELEGVRVVTFSVVDQAGRPIPDSVVVVLSRPDQKDFEGHILPRGKARVVTGAPSLDIFAYAKGFAHARVLGVTSGQKIVLGPAFEVRLSVPKGIGLPSPPFEMEVELEPLDPLVPTRGNSTLHRGPRSTSSSFGHVAWANRCKAQCDVRGRAVVLVPWTGRYRVRWWLFRTKADSRPGQPVGTEKAAKVIHVDGSGSLDVTGTFTEAALEKARARLAK